MLARFTNFTSIDGSAEATGLPDASVDFVTAAQAAHWFDRAKSRGEFVRILKPRGWLVLLWNERLIHTTPFLQDYEHLLLKYGTDYQEIRHERTTAAVHEFFNPLPFEERTFDVREDMDYDGTKGRLLSSSYVPGAGEPRHNSMLKDLRRIFGVYAVDGKVAFQYKTRVFYGHLTT